MNNISLSSLLRNKAGKPPSEKLVIVGVNPLIDQLTKDPELLYDLLRVENNLKITILYENETENFNQSLFFDKDNSRHKVEFDKLQTYRNRLIGRKGKKRVGLVADVLQLFENSERDENENRIVLYQNNLRHNVNLIQVDDIILYCTTTIDIPSLDMYSVVTSDSNPTLYKHYSDYIEFLLKKDAGLLYLSKVGDELIELYDMNSIPRGIYPRKAFYTDDYQRHSIWAFVYNRKGELLLHKRSERTADNRSLWDKSAGGHVDIIDSSTIMTAKRELIEELFLPEAEYTQYMSAELGDIIDFGEWNIIKRPEKHFKSSFDGLDEIDWVVFRATERDERGKYVPMTVRRKSPRKIHLLVDGEEKVVTWFTRFISDVYLFIAPDNYIETPDEMHRLFEVAEKRGAATSHKLVNIEELIKDVRLFPERYTDDMVYMCSEKKWLLLQFSESLKYIFQKETN